jgi:hypothetical protein
LVITMPPDRNPIIWSNCERCRMPVAMLAHDELAYLMSIHNGLAHFACPTEHDLERIMTHANPSAHSSANRRLAGGPVQLVFTTAPGPERA